MTDWVYLILLIAAGLVFVSVLTSLLAFRLGAPLLLVFLGVGLLAAEDGLAYAMTMPSRPISLEAWLLQ